MERSTMDIVSACRGAVAQYDALCRGFLGQPGKVAVERKCNFMILLGTIDKSAPTAALIQIYDFYKAQNISSRLRNCIQDALMILLDINIPEVETNLYRAASKLLEAEAELVRRMDALKQEVGMISHPDLPLMTLSAARG